MIKKITIMFLSALILSSCSSTKKSGMSSAGEMSLVDDFEKNVGDRVFFAYDSSKISKASEDQLKKQVEWFRSHPNANATIEGHCDERGTREYNLALGERRAEAVKHFLSKHGIENHRLDTISYGKERPAVIGHDENHWQQNRRGVTSVR